MGAALETACIFFAGTLVSDPIIRPSADGDLTLLRIKVDGPQEHLEWVHAAGSLGRFVAETGFTEGDAVLVIGELCCLTVPDDHGQERTECLTLAHRLTHDESARWVDQP